MLIRERVEMNLSLLGILGLVTSIVILVAISGCISAIVPPSVYSNNTNAKVTESGDTITISGTKTDPDHDQYSDKFELKKGAYLITWENSNKSERSFIAFLEAKAGVESLGSDKPNGSSVLVIGGFLSQPGFYKLDVIYGDTYTVTITKPSSGTVLPLTVDWSESERIPVVIQLNPGELLFDVNYKSPSTSWTAIDLYNVNTGEKVYSGKISVPAGLTGTNSTNIETAGVYIMDIYAINGTSVTISQ